MHDYLSRNTTLILTPRRPALLAGFDNVLEVLVRIQAPAMPDGAARPRPAYGIGLVLDRSGSMAGLPLAEARRCASFVIERLRGDDVVSLVQFDDRVQLLCPAQARGDGEALRQAIAQIEEGGYTNLHGGWRKGADSLLPAVNATGLRRVILLSDGCANKGVTDSGEIAGQCRSLAAMGITTSTYGLGDHFNEELMVAMAEAGQGNHYYGDTAEDLMTPFQEEFDLLANLCVKGLKLHVSVPAGAQVELLNDYLGDAAAGWRLPDLAWGAEAWAVLRIRLPAVGAEGAVLPCLEVAVSGTDLDGEPVSLRPDGLALPTLNPSALAAVAEDPLLMRRLLELEAGGMLRRTREAVRSGDWAQVDRILAEAEGRYANNEWVASVVAAIRGIAHGRARDRLMKEALYSARKLSGRLSSRDERDELGEAGKATYLRRRIGQGKVDPGGRS